MTPCARHHLAWGQHAPGCTCTPECSDHEGHCTGCLPVEASNGLLCSTDSRRLRGFLGAEEGLDPEHPVHGLPWAWEHLEVAYPSLSQAPGDGGGSGPADREAQRLADVLSVRGDTHFWLQLWTLKVMNAGGLAGPDFPAGERLDIRRFAEWLLTNIEVMEQHPDIADAIETFAELMARVHNLAPWREAATQIRGIPCRCGATALHDLGDRIICALCRRPYTRDEYRIWTKVAGRRFEDDPRALAEYERGRLEHTAAGYGGRA